MPADQPEKDSSCPSAGDGDDDDDVSKRNRLDGTLACRERERFCSVLVLVIGLVVVVPTLDYSPSDRRPARMRKRRLLFPKW